MYEGIGFSVFAFSTMIFLAAAVTWVVGFRFKMVRSISCRLVFMFAVFAAAGAYVWTEAGPSADEHLQIIEMPTLPLPTPTYYWV